MRSEEVVVSNPCGMKLPDGVEKVRMAWKGPDGALPLFIGGGDRLGGEGVLNTVSS